MKLKNAKVVRASDPRPRRPDEMEDAKGGDYVQDITLLFDDGTQIDTTSDYIIRKGNEDMRDWEEMGFDEDEISDLEEWESAQEDDGDGGGGGGVDVDDDLLALYLRLGGPIATSSGEVVNYWNDLIEYMNGPFTGKVKKFVFDVKGDKEDKWKAHSSSGKVYNITVRLQRPMTGEQWDWGCSCPGWQYSGEDRRCSHIDEFKKKIKAFAVSKGVTT